MTTAAPVRPTDDHGLLMIGNRRCLGFLLDFTSCGRGVYDAEYGLVDVTPEQAKRHNELLSEGQILGLDKNCEVGQCGSFYVHERTDGTGYEVRTFIGTRVDEWSRRDGRSLEFFRKGELFRGRLPGDGGNLFSFKRIS